MVMRMRSAYSNGQTLVKGLSKRLANLKAAREKKNMADSSGRRTGVPKIVIRSASDDASSEKNRTNGEGARSPSNQPFLEGNEDSSIKNGADSSYYSISERRSVPFDANVTIDDVESALSTDSQSTDNSGSESDVEDNFDETVEDDLMFDEDVEQQPDQVWLRTSRPEIPRNRPAIESLPDTVTRLETPEGSKVFLVGTAHFSLESQEDVAKTIQTAQPDVVVMELCKGRVNILQMDEKTILEEAKVMNLDKVRTTIKQNGFVHGVMYLFLLSMSAHLTKQLGMAPGGEFRRAFAEAKKVPGCLIHLGDRPIRITLQRALAELTVWQKLCLVWCLVTSKDPVSKEEVERYKNRDLIEEMLAEMTGKFPSISRVFVKERDVYLTHSLHVAASPIPCASSETGFVPSVVVGVVGIGHVPGIVEHWGKVRSEDIPPLLSIPESSLSNRIFHCTVKASVFGLFAWGCYKVVTRPSILNLFSKLNSLKGR